MPAWQRRVRHESGPGRLHIGQFVDRWLVAGQWCKPPAHTVFPGYHIERPDGRERHRPGGRDRARMKHGGQLIAHPLALTMLSGGAQANPQCVHRNSRASARRSGADRAAIDVTIVLLPGTWLAARSAHIRQPSHVRPPPCGGCWTGRATALRRERASFALSRPARLAPLVERARDPARTGPHDDLQRVEPSLFSALRTGFEGAVCNHDAPIRPQLLSRLRPALADAAATAPRGRPILVRLFLSPSCTHWGTASRSAAKAIPA